MSLFKGIRDLIRKAPSVIAEFAGSPGVAPRAPDYNLELLYDKISKSWVMQEIFRPIITEVLRPGWVVIPKFGKKCEKCGAEYESASVTKCGRCGGTELRIPDWTQLTRIETLMDKPNSNRDTMRDILSSLLYHVLASDEYYLSVAYAPAIREGKETGDLYPKEIYVEHPKNFKPLMDERARLRGKKEHFCPVCYPEASQDALPNPGNCKVCGRELTETAYIQEVGSITNRFGIDQVVHGNHFKVLPYPFGAPRARSIWSLIWTIGYMDDWFFDTYKEGKIGKIIVFENYKPEEVKAMAEKMREQEKALDAIDATSGETRPTRKIRNLLLGSAGPVGVHDAMPNPGEMQALDYYLLAIQACCLFPSAKTLTSTGWKQIRDVQVGEKVLTHEGNWKPVIEKFSREYFGETIKIRVEGSNHFGSPIWLTMTPEHPILTRRGWVKAGELTLDDEAALLGSFCKACGAPTPFSGSYCSRKCRTHARDYSKSRKGLGEHTRISPMEREFVLKRDGGRCMECGKQINLNSPHNYEIHHRLPKRLGGTQHPDNLITLCKKCHNSEYVLIKHAIQRLSETDKLETFNSVFEHNIFSKLFRPITKIIRKSLKRTMRVYNLAVADDNSYVANTVIVHNCGVFGVQPLFVAFIEKGKAGTTPYMQIEVFDRTIEDHQLDIEERFTNQLFPIFGVMDFQFKFNPIEKKDEMRDAQIAKLRAETMLTWRNAGFKVVIDKDGRLWIRNDEGKTVEGEQGAGESPRGEKESEASGALINETTVEREPHGPRPNSPSMVV
jgi:hypothetical protein